MYCELQFTSASRGLLPGASGYCTVKATAGIPNSLRSALEGLSHYRHVFAPGDANAALNPVAWSHTILNAAGRQWHVLSRTQASGVDHTRRSNNFSHHLAIPDDDLPNAGPAWLVSQRGVLQTAWNQTVGELPAQNRLPPGRESMSVCQHWEAATGDAGWGGAVAAHLVNTNAPVVIVFQLGQDVLPLFREAIALLPENQRWSVTFSTFFTGQSATCRLRGVLAGSPELAQLRRLPQALVLDLTSQQSVAPEGDFTDAARTGRRRNPSGATAPRQTVRTKSLRDSGDDFVSVPSRATTNEVSRSRIPTAPPILSADLRRPVQKSAVPTFWLIGGAVATVCVLVICSVFAIRWSLPAPKAVTKRARLIAEVNPKHINDVAAPLPNAKQVAESVEVAAPEKAFEKPGIPSAPQDFVRRILVEPFDDHADQVEVTKRSEVDHYAGLMSESKVVRIPTPRWPIDTPWELEFLGMPDAYHLESKEGANGIPVRWMMRAEDDEMILDIHEASTPEVKDHRELVLEIRIVNRDKVRDVAFAMANCVLVLTPVDKPAYQISFRDSPRTIDQRVELPTHGFKEISIQYGHRLQPSLPQEKGKYPLYLRDLRIDVEAAEPKADNAVQRHFPDLNVCLKREWNESGRSLNVKWEPNTESKNPSDDGLVIHNMRLSYLVGNVYVDLLRVDAAKVPSEGKPVRRKQPNEED